MYIGKDFDPADPDESEVYSFDFVKELASGETISSATWSCEVADDSEVQDASASSRLSGSPSSSGQVTSHRVAGLVAGVKYVLHATVVTSSSNHVALHSHVLCVDPG